MCHCNTHCNIDSTNTATFHSTTSQQTLTNSSHLNIILTNSIQQCNTHCSIDSTNTTTFCSTMSQETLTNSNHLKITNSTEYYHSSRDTRKHNASHCNTHCNTHCNVDSSSTTKSHTTTSQEALTNSSYLNITNSRRCVLQCVAVCCSVLQCVAVCCSVKQCVAVCCSVLQCVAVCCSCGVLQRAAVCFLVYPVSSELN